MRSDSLDTIIRRPDTARHNRVGAPESTSLLSTPGSKLINVAKRVVDALSHLRDIVLESVEAKCLFFS